MNEAVTLPSLTCSSDTNASSKPRRVVPDSSCETHPNLKPDQVHVYRVAAPINHIFKEEAKHEEL